MLLKKLVAVVSAVVVIAVPYVKVLADDTVITLDETAKKFDIYKNILSIAFKSSCRASCVDYSQIRRKC